MLRYATTAWAALALWAGAASAQPTDVAVSASNRSLTIAWTAAGDTVYNLYIAAEPGVTVANVELLSGGRGFDAVATPFTLSGLDNNRPYFIVVGEVASGGVVLESEEVIGIPRGVWEQQLAGTLISAVAADPEVEGVYLAGGSGEGEGCDAAPKVPGCDIFRSTDSGATWASVTGGVNEIDIRAVDIRGGVGIALSLAAAGTNEKLFVSNTGDAWALSLNTQAQLEDFKTAHIDPNNAMVAYTANVSLPPTAGQSRTLKTNNLGSSVVAWSPLNEIVTGALDARTIKVRPGDEQVVWLGGTGTPPLAISSNAGTSFMANAAAGVTAVRDIELNPDNPDQMWIAGSTAAGPTVLFSADGGLDFEARDTGLPGGSINDLAYDPADQLLFAATQQGVYSSADLGQSWSKLGSGLDGPTTALAHGPSQVLVAATADGVFRLDLEAPPPIEDIPDAGVDAGDGPPPESGCCQTSGGGAGSTAALALLVLIATAGRGRRSPAGRRRPAKSAARRSARTSARRR